MLGAIIGDTAGSVYEFGNIKTTEFDLIDKRCCFTDDSVLTLAVADWLLSDPQHTDEVLEEKLVSYAKNHPNVMGGYGGGFECWVRYPEELIDWQTQKTFADGKRHPYNSCGNGSAMRASAVGWMFDTLEETERVAGISAAVTHNHPEGIKGAQATAAAIFMARTGSSKDEIKKYISDKYGYNLNRTCDDIRPKYRFEATCQETVPQAMVAFFDSKDFESAIRLGVSLGGDSDTLTCITGGIAEAFYKKIPADIAKRALDKLPKEFKDLIEEFTEKSFYVKTY